MQKQRSLAAGLSILAIMFAAAVAGLLAAGPIPQDPGYHAFADTRAVFGVPNFANVVSNFGFLFVGALGLMTVLGSTGQPRFEHTWEKRPYTVFFAAVLVVGLGSAYYHLNPGTGALFWDRLPMTVAFMALFSAVIADRVDPEAGAIWGLPALVLLGVASVVYWDWTEGLGRGNLGPYALVQFFPLVAIPVILWLFPGAKYTRGRALAWMVVWYLFAKILEHYDGWIFDHSAQVVSGHSLKHLVSAVAAFVLYRMLSPRPRFWIYPPS